MARAHCGMASRKQFFLCVKYLFAFIAELRVARRYVPTRKAADSIATALSNVGVPSRAFHAGHPRKLLETVQREFTCGSLQVSTWDFCR